MPDHRPDLQTKLVVQQYVDLLPDKIRKKQQVENNEKELVSIGNKSLISMSGKTETGSAEEQPVRDNQITKTDGG